MASDKLKTSCALQHLICRWICPPDFQSRLGTGAAGQLTRSTGCHGGTSGTAICYQSPALHTSCQRSMVGAPCAAPVPFHALTLSRGLHAVGKREGQRAPDANTGSTPVHAFKLYTSIVRGCPSWAHLCSSSISTLQGVGSHQMMQTSWSVQKPWLNLQRRVRVIRQRCANVIRLTHPAVDAQGPWTRRRRCGRCSAHRLTGRRRRGARGAAAPRASYSWTRAMAAGMAALLNAGLFSINRR